MMRNLFATTALVALMTAPVFAQSATETKPVQENAAAEDTATPETMPRGGFASVNIRTLGDAETSGFLASDLMGRSVYTGTGEEAESVGEIDDLVVSQEGAINAVVIGVGGFLGIGEKDVAVGFDRLAVEQVGEGSMRLTTDVSAEELEQAAAYEAPLEERDAGAMTSEAADPNAAEQTETVAQETSEEVEQTAENAEQSAEEASQEVAAATESSENMAAEGATEEVAAYEDPRDPAQRDVFAENKTMVEANELSADQVIGATVYDANYENIGEISDVLLNADGQAEAAIIDVGGFLGLGEKPVAVSFDKVEFMKDEGGGLFISTPYTEDRLESATAYDENAWNDKRDEMLLRPAQ